ncbi:MAG: LysM peptidoglycan-binding domain-containing protein [Gammaproteobacteria bacterium]|nr:LysM peptidoglycan-binding domain-containing protein [Gammaproteobacteria bacterium]NNC98329.1 LysM peptidoglycan-binding domain-containing protein [Gammaproteobacteria bacterium]NNM14412.1 LysM peptidoglycan-binding domain-containing protein [Gammaproteobacteria bacterium]
MRNKISIKSIALLFSVFAILLTSHANADENQISYIEGVDYIVIDSSVSSSIAGSNINQAYYGRIYPGLVANFSLPAQTTEVAVKRINSQYNWFKKNPQYMQRVWKRAAPYLYHIVRELEKRDMPMELALLPIVESAYDPFAYSHGRAAGLWQIIPGTGKYLGVQQDWWYDGRRDVLDSTRAALDYLESLHKQFKGDWLLAIAAYNSGGGNVRKGIRRNTRKQRPTDFWSLPLPKETKAYVPKLLALKKLFLENSTQNMLPSIPNSAHFTSIDISSQIDLATASELAGIDLDTLYKLNPGFNHWASAPHGPHRLLIPVSRADAFQTQLAELPAEQRIKLQRYQVKPGDTLSVLARRNKTSIVAIQQANSLQGHNLRAGQHLLIPQASASQAKYSKTQDARRQRIQSTNRKGTRINYVVKPGDSFWKISNHFNVQQRKLAQWNGMAPGDTLKIGQKLVVWSKDRSLQIDSAPVNGVQTQRKIHYKVRRGDTLSGIAAKFKVRTSQLQAWNRTRLGKYLQPGQTLKILVDVRKQSGS